MMMPVSGNIMENMDGRHWKNFFFRNGMTVSMTSQRNGTTEQVDMARQREIAGMPDSQIASIPSGLTRFWRTKPSQFAARFPSSGAPLTVRTPQDRQKWLDLARVEMLAALQSPNNHLLEAWVAAHPKTLARGTCPSDNDP
ncbi:hypothetical protein NKJ36_27225 [Mesorhizobium sp. M0142]